MFGLNKRDMLYPHEDLSTNRTKKSRNLLVLFAINLQYLVLTNNVTSKCINKESLLFLHGFAVEPHVHLVPHQGQPRFAFVFCFVEQVLS